jgi:hypothetical protein
VEQVREETMKTRTLIPTFLFAISLTCQCLVAQSAWTPPKGTYSVAISYQNNLDNAHSFVGGQQYLIQNGQKVYGIATIRTQAAYVDFGYAFTDKLSASFTIPYMTSKYDGTGPHLFYDPVTKAIANPIDNGNYHGGIQDFGFRLRYNIATRPFMITPFLQYSVPSHDYPFYSHSVIGNHVSEFQIGSFLGSFLTDRIYLAGGYGLGFPQKILGISRIHHHMELEGGYFINEKIRTFGILHGQLTHGGIELIQDPSSYNSGPVLFEGFGLPVRYLQTGKGGYSSADPLFFHHLQIQKDTFLNLSVGTEYSFSSGLSAYGVLERTLTNQNLHVMKYGLTLGVAWGFNGRSQRPCHC